MSVTGQNLERLGEFINGATGRLMSPAERDEALSAIQQLEERIHLANAEIRTLRNFVAEPTASAKSDTHLRRTIACACSACGAQPLKPCSTPEGRKGIWCLIPEGQEPLLDWTTLAFNATELYLEKRAPVAMRLPCERCGTLHIDVGKFATHPHHTHTCQHCGLNWRPAKEHTIGVQWIPDFKNEEPTESLLPYTSTGWDPR